MKIENIDTSPDIIKRKKTCIFEDGFRNKLLRDSEGEIFCGIQVYNLFINGVKHSVLYFDDLVEMLGLPDGQKPRFKTLFISTNFRKMFVLRRGGYRKGYCRATEIKKYSNYYKQYFPPQNGASFSHDSQQLAGVIINQYPSYVVNNFSRVRMNFGQVNSSVRNFLEAFLIPIAKVVKDCMKSNPNDVISDVKTYEFKFQKLNTASIIEPEPLNQKQWVIACSHGDGLRFHDDKIWHSETDCRDEVARLVLTTGHPHVKLLIQERAEISTSIVWS